MHLFNAVSITLEAGPVVLSASNFNKQSFTYCIMEDITVPVDSTGIATFDNVYVCEGSYLNSVYTVNLSLPNQKFVLPNVGIDTDNLNVIVRRSLEIVLRGNIQDMTISLVLTVTHPLLLKRN